MIDVKHKTCKECDIVPVYNYEDQKQGLYCKKHAKTGMIDVKNKTCKDDNCNIRPVYNYKNYKQGLYCKQHALSGMINVKDKKCIQEGCDTFANKKYEGYCVHCYIHLFPDKPNSRNYKTKEQAVVEFVKSTFPDITIITDKKIEGGCSRRRPDILIDTGSQVIDIEVDENMHKDYDINCENKRIMEIARDLRHRDILFIRFNPDSYTITGKIISSCWKLDGYGMCVINNMEDWVYRLNVLKSLISECLTRKLKKNLQTFPLFYDDWLDNLRKINLS